MKTRPQRVHTAAFGCTCGDRPPQLGCRPRIVWVRVRATYGNILRSWYTCLSAGPPSWPENGEREERSGRVRKERADRGRAQWARRGRAWRAMWTRAGDGEQSVVVGGRRQRSPKSPRGEPRFAADPPALAPVPPEWGISVQKVRGLCRARSQDQFVRGWLFALLVCTLRHALCSAIDISHLYPPTAAPSPALYTISVAIQSSLLSQNGLYYTPC